MGKIRGKLFRLLFSGQHKDRKAMIDYIKNQSRAIQKKQTEIQILKRKMRKMEREK